MNHMRAPVAMSAPVVPAAAAVAHHPLSLRAEAQAEGVSPSTVHRRRAAEAAAERALLRARAKRAVDKTAKRGTPAERKPVAPAAPDVAAALASLASAMQQQSVLLGTLLSAMEPIAVPAAEMAQAAAKPQTASSRAKAASNAAEAPLLMVARKAEFVSPLGASGPYMGTIFGVSGIRRPSVAAPVGPAPTRILAIGDSHFHPGLPQTVRCMTLVGLHAAATQPAHVVHIGDGSDWNSVCRHTRNETWKAREKPSLRQDLDNWRENWTALNAPMDDAGATSSRHYCMGNHDAWVEAFEDACPEAKGMATGERDGVLEQAGWSHTAYGEFRFIAGVGFVHVPLNLMGRPVGGQMPETSISNQVTHDLVFGHTHRHNAVNRPKMGFSNRVTVVNTGSSMPEFYVGDYAQNTMGSAISHGVLDIDVFDGRIQGFRFTTMRELEERYGLEADRRLS